MFFRGFCFLKLQLIWTFSILDMEWDVKCFQCSVPPGPSWCFKVLHVWISEWKWSRSVWVHSKKKKRQLGSQLSCNVHNGDPQNRLSLTRLDVICGFFHHCGLFLNLPHNPQLWAAYRPLHSHCDQYDADGMLSHNIKPMCLVLYMHQSAVLRYQRSSGCWWWVCLPLQSIFDQIRILGMWSPHPLVHMPK